MAITGTPTNGYTISHVIGIEAAVTQTARTSTSSGNYLSSYINSYIRIRTSKQRSKYVTEGFRIFIWATAWIIEWIGIWTDRGAIARTMTQVITQAFPFANDHLIKKNSLCGIGT